MAVQRRERVAEGGIVAMLRGTDADTALEVAPAVVDGGITALEATADTPNVAETIDTTRRNAAAFVSMTDERR